MVRTNTAKFVGECTSMPGYRPIVIVLHHKDKCRLCLEIMESLKFGLWLGKNRGVVHEKCYKDLMEKETTW